MKTTVYALIVAVVFCACEKRKRCKSEDSIAGIISTAVNLPYNISEAGRVEGGQYVIENDSVYKACFSGSGQELPEIDFSTNTLLGYPSTNSCNTSYHRNVQANQVTHAYTYQLQVYECHTFYAKACENDNWVLVPKLPPGWKIEFEMKEN